MLFLTKTAYAIALSVAFGALLWAFPFLPRQPSATDGLTIGIPAFFLALMPNTRRYTPGFLKRSLTFAVPAGLIVTAAVVALNVYSTLTGGYTADAARTASRITLALVALWILLVTSRPVNLQRAAIIGVMCTGLLLVLTVPLVHDFFTLEWPPPDLMAASLGAALGGCLAVEILARAHSRRYPHE